MVLIVMQLSTILSIPKLRIISPSRARRPSAVRIPPTPSWRAWGLHQVGTTTEGLCLVPEDLQSQSLSVAVMTDRYLGIGGLLRVDGQLAM